MKILITGGASGVGESITRAIAKDSSNEVFFTYNSSGEKAKKLEKDFQNIRALSCNYSSIDDIGKLENWILESDLNVLIHNAYSGDFLTTHFHKIAYADFESSFNQNILPLIRITQQAIRLFRKKKSGKIINILSAALVNKPPVGAAIYAATKAYHESLSKSWATENSSFGITSNSISPSLMKTKLTQKIDERIVEQIETAHPLKRLLSGEEVAKAVMYLLHASPDVNGINLVLNAGMDLG